MAPDVNWESEVIPDECQVFMNAHKGFFKGDELLPGVFRKHGGGMSVNWEKYATAAITRNQAKTPDDNAVLKMQVSSIRSISELQVEHTPDLERNNRAHTDVLGIPDGGELQTQLRSQLLDIAQIVLAV